MVEIMDNMRKRYIVLAAALAAFAVPLGAQQPAVEARIAGLERNAEYMELLKEDAQLQFREDSTVHAVERLRERLREDPARRQAFSQEILELENRIFEIRSNKGRVIDRINAIEQEWVFANLSSGAPLSGSEPAGGPEKVPDSLKVRNLTDNVCFRRELPAADYEALRRAQQLEFRAVEYVNDFFGNLSATEALAAAYDAATTEAEALEIRARCDSLQEVGRVLADSLASVWNYIYDNKSYAYGYLMDKLGEEEILAREERASADAVREAAALAGQTASDAVADYFLRKRVAVDYETAVAGVLELDAARDSLRGVAAQLTAIDFRRPRVVLGERSFIEYDSVAFSAKPVYTYQNPIPECRVYASGTIYRILLGTFNTKRAAATFRGAYPLFYRIDEEGKWCYYAGGFATRAEADAAQLLLKKRGFVRPEVVVWTDGAYHNLAQEPEALAVSYRVEITGSEALSDAMKAVIGALAEGAGLSRAGERLYVVGSFDDPAVAERVAAELRLVDASLEIKVAKISQ